MDESHLTLLYTANIAGRLDSLPRLFSHIQSIRAEAPGPTSLLDLGGTCDPAVWECAVTADRAVLFVLDAMGYDGACLTPRDCARMDNTARQKLAERTSTALCALIPEPGFQPVMIWQAGDYALACCGADTATPNGADLTITPSRTGPLARLDREARRLYLTPPEGSTLGIATITFDRARLPVRVAGQQQSVPADARPDATVAAAVEFVRDEARVYQRTQQRGAHETG